MRDLRTRPYITIDMHYGGAPAGFITNERGGLWCSESTSEGYFLRGVRFVSDDPKAMRALASEANQVADALDVGIKEWRASQKAKPPSYAHQFVVFVLAAVLFIALAMAVLA